MSARSLSEIPDNATHFWNDGIRAGMTIFTKLESRYWQELLPGAVFFHLPRRVKR